MNRTEVTGTAVAQPRLALFLPNLGGGGAERVTLNLARGLHTSGHAVDLVLVDASGAYRDAVPEGVRIVELGGGRTRAALPALVRYLRRTRPIGLLSALNHANVIAVWAASIAGYRGRVLVAEHSELLPAAPTLWMRAFTASMRLSYVRAARVIAVSHGVKRSLVEIAGVPAEHIEVIYNPVIGPDLRSRDRPRPTALPSDGVANIVAVGRLVREKDFANLLRAFALLRAQRAARLMILGEGPERGALEALRTSLGLHRDVVLPGFVANAYDYLAHADLVALSSVQEGLPTVLIEALALGAPVVSTDCPSGPSEILAEGAYGTLVPVGDSPALAAAMLAALETPPPTIPATWLEQFTEEASVGRYLRAFGFGNEYGDGSS